MRKLIGIAPVLAVVCMSCTGGGDEIAMPECVKSADIVREDAGVTSRYFDTDNPYTLRRVAGALEAEAVRATMESFDRSGYACEPEHSFVAEGEGPGGESLEIAALPMVRREGERIEVVYVLSLESVRASYVVPVRFSFADAPIDDDAYEIGEGVWMALAGEPLGADARLGAANLSWRAWFRCLAERMAAGLASCAWTCQFAPTLYLHCLAQCTAGYVIYALISCTFQAL